MCSPNLDPMPRDLTEMAKGKLISVLGCEGAWLNAISMTDINEVNTHRTLRADTYLVAAQLAAAGSGAVMLPRSMADPYIKSGLLISLIIYCARMIIVELSLKSLFFNNGWLMIIRKRNLTRINHRSNLCMPNQFIDGGKSSRHNRSFYIIEPQANL